MAFVTPPNSLPSEQQQTRLHNTLEQTTGVQLKRERW